MSTTPDKKYNVMISNVFGTINRGDALLVESLMDQLEEIFSDKATYYGIANRPDLQYEHLPFIIWTQQPGRSDAKNVTYRRIENAIYTLGSLLYVGMGAPKLFPAFLLPKSQQESFLNLKKSDIVISCPGGFLVEESLPILVSLLQLWAAKKFGKPLIFAPQTVGPIKNPHVKKICGYILRKVDTIFVREDYTKDFVINELGVDPSRVIRAVDMALSHKKSDTAAGKEVIKNLGFGEDEKFLGASIIEWVFPKSDNARLAQNQYEEKMAAIFTRVYKELGIRTLVFNQVSADLKAAKRVQKLAGDFVVVDEADRTVSVMRSMIGSSYIFLGSRLHSCIFALLEHAPTTALSYNYKTDGIMNDIGQYHKVRKIETFDVEDIVASLNNDFHKHQSRTDEVRESLSKPDNAIFKNRLADVVAKF